MVALLKKLATVSFWSWEGPAEPRQAQQGSYPEELSDDQVAYLHERAAERRRAWAAHAATNAAVSPK